MNTNEPNSESFDEQQSLQVIREMIRVSHKKLKNDGILFIVWGWIMFYVYIASYILSTAVLTFPLRKILNCGGYAIGIMGLAFTIYYIIKQRRKVQTYIGISLRYVWITLIICLMVINLIEANVLHKIIFELQHPIFMMFIAYAIIITGGILRYRMMIAGGIVFGILAYLGSHLSLQNQLLAEASAWLIAFIIPGHILFSKRKS